MPSRRLFLLSASTASLLTACGDKGRRKSPLAPDQTLAQARAGFKTRLARQYRDGTAFDKPPAGVFDLVSFPSSVGALGAYLTPIPDDGQQHPAIIWITGGDSNTIGDVWSPQPPDNNQTADAYRKAGIIMMFPSLRGGNTNPGYEEFMYGELDDVLAARDFLAGQKGVDPTRIYLGGHSRGGTLVLLLAEYSDRFRAVFAFGPVADLSRYGPDKTTFDRSDRREFRLRGPVHWLSSVKTPTFVIEGHGGNLDDLLVIRQVAAATTTTVRTFVIAGASHFSTLAPANALIARKIVADTGKTTNITLTEAELNAAAAS